MDASGVEGLTLKLIYNTSEQHKQIATVISQMWKQKLGVGTELTNFEWKTYITIRNNQEFGRGPLRMVRRLQRGVDLPRPCSPPPTARTPGSTRTRRWMRSCALPRPPRTQAGSTRRSSRSLPKTWPLSRFITIPIRFFFPRISRGGPTTTWRTTGTRRTCIASRIDPGPGRPARVRRPVFGWSTTSSNDWRSFRSHSLRGSRLSPVSALLASRTGADLQLPRRIRRCFLCPTP